MLEKTDQKNYKFRNLTKLSQYGLTILFNDWKIQRERERERESFFMLNIYSFSEKKYGQKLLPKPYASIFA